MNELRALARAGHSLRLLNQFIVEIHGGSHASNYALGDDVTVNAELAVSRQIAFEIRDRVLDRYALAEKGMNRAGCR